MAQGTTLDGTALSILLIAMTPPARPPSRCLLFQVAPGSLEGVIRRSSFGAARAVGPHGALRIYRQPAARIPAQ
ncbi:MAG: hypothetical protein WBX30_29345 [Stellaceae bacterium]